jgi:outer membrane receptor for ferrienterochelin and colicins
MKSLLLTMGISIISFSSYSQSITGLVLDESNTPIPQAMVRIKNTQTAVNTDEKGTFKITKNKKIEWIIVSSIGYFNDTILSINDKPLKIILKQKSMKEVTIKSSIDNPFQVNNLFIDRIDKTELCKLACCNLAESFENSNTVDVVYSDGVTGNREIVMLGLTGAYTQMLQENIPTMRGITLKAGLEQLPGTWIENISVNKGAGSVVNGYESMAGQINLELKKPRSSDRAFFNLFVSEIGKTDINFDVAHTFSDKWSSQLFLHTNFQPMKVDYYKDGFMDMPLVNNFNVFNRWHYMSGNKLAAQFGFQSTYENKKAGQMEFDFATPDTSKYGVKIENIFNSFYAKTGYQIDQNNQSIGITYKLQHNTQKGFIGRSELDMYELYGNINAIYQDRLFHKEDHLIKAGASFTLDIVEEKLGNTTFNKNEKIPGLFVEHTYSKDSTLMILNGLRYDIHSQWGGYLSPRSVVKFSPDKHWSVRLSAGKGWRTTALITENMGWMVSSRSVQILETLRPEKSWNYGVSINNNTIFKSINSNIDLTFFCTDFENQIIADVETNGVLKLYNLNGRSVAYSTQLDHKLIFSKNFDVKYSFKNDYVFSTYSGERLIKPLLNQSKFLINPYFSSNNQKWKSSTTILYNGTSRIPYKGYIGGNTSPDYWVIHQLFTFSPSKTVDVYIGGENLTNFRQSQLIISPENPFGAQFDASQVWGLADGRRIYGGVRVRFLKK